MRHVFVRQFAFDRPVAEVGRIYEFYEKNPSEFLRDRDPRQILESVKEAYGFTVESDAGEIVGVCFMFDYGGRDVEFGGTRITLNGFGLQKLLLQCRLAVAYSFDLFSRHCFTVVREANAASTRSVSTCGLPRRDDLARDLRAYGVDDPSRSNKPIFAIGRTIDVATEQLLAETRESLLALHGAGRIEKDGKRLNVTLDFPLMRNPHLRAGLLLP
ncbi:MAG: hypothetical protein KF914_12645 [Rhizobiaceae bacterium]|nr:hypothetical protein [Rhizobiaceae bacterium]